MTTLEVRKVLNEMKATSAMMILKKMTDLRRIMNTSAMKALTGMIISVEMSASIGMKAIENLTKSLMATTKAIPLQ